MFVLFAFALKPNARAQTKFNHTFGGICEVEGTFVEFCHDSGFVIASNSCYGAYIVRTDSMGDTLWTRMIMDTVSGNPNNFYRPEIYCIRETPDHGFIITGKLDYNGYCLKIDSIGNKLWSNDQPFNFTEWGAIFQNILIQDTGGYVIAGYGDDIGPVNYAFYFGITDNGDTTYTHLYNSGGGNLQCFKQTYDGGIILLSIDQSQNQFYLEKHGGGGGSWTLTPAFDIYCIHPLADSGYIFGGSWLDQSSVIRYGLIRTDTLGDTLWRAELGFIPIDIVSVNSPTPGYAMIYNVSRPTQIFWPSKPFCEVQNSDFVLVRTDIIGNILWSKTFGGSISDGVSNIINVPGDGFSFVGQTKSEKGYSEINFIRTDSQGNDH